MSGADLAQRAVAQAKKFGAELLTAQEVVKIEDSGSYKTVKFKDGTEVSASSIVLATGMKVRKLEAKGIEVLLDDRTESPGVKFNDADLLGIPLRVTVSPRTLEKGSAEIKRRTERETELAPLEEVTARLKELIAEGIKAS